MLKDEAAFAASSGNTPSGDSYSKNRKLNVSRDLSYTWSSTSIDGRWYVTPINSAKECMYLDQTNNNYFDLAFSV